MYYQKYNKSKCGAVYCLANKLYLNINNNVNISNSTKYSIINRQN